MTCVPLGFQVSIFRLTCLRNRLIISSRDLDTIVLVLKLTNLANPGVFSPDPDQ